MTHKIRLSTDESVVLHNILKHLTLPVLLPHAKLCMDADGHHLGESALTDNNFICYLFYTHARLAMQLVMPSID